MTYNLYEGVSREGSSKLTLIVSSILLALMVTFMTVAQGVSATPSTEVVYDSLASVDPTTNYPSQPFQAQQTSEFGDFVHLAGSARQLSSVDLTMSNWAKASTPTNEAWCAENTESCDSTGYALPITVNIYADTLGANNVPTTVLGTKTVDVHVPWRPESDSSCPATSNGTGWKEDGICVNFSGIAFNANFDLSSLNLNLPDDVIVGFAYNTQTYGEEPTGVNGPYNSLNIAVPANQVVAVGADDDSDGVFWDSTYSGRTAGFALDTGWTPYGTVPMRITATQAVNAPTNKDLCKKNGWMSYTDMNGNSFKNQGQCVSSVVSNRNN